jgi:hypothetical protein
MPALDGLRAISIALVLPGHLSGTRGFPTINLARYVGDYANLGVMMFFVISGYLISTLLLEESQRFGEHFLAALLCPARATPLPGVFFVGGFSRCCGADRVDPAESRRLGCGFYLYSQFPDAQQLVHRPPLVALGGGAVLPALAHATGDRRKEAGRESRVCRTSGIASGPDCRHHVRSSWGDLSVCCGFPGERLPACHLRRCLATLALVHAVVRVEIFSARLHRRDMRLQLGTQIYDRECFRCIDHQRASRPCGSSLRGVTVENSRVLVWVGVLSYSLYLWQQFFLNQHSTWPICRFPFNVLLAILAAAISYCCVE